MKRDLLLQLLKEIRDSNILLSSMEEIFKTNNKNCFEMLLNLTDEQVKSILDFESDRLKVFQIYMYLNKTRIPDKIYEMLAGELLKKNKSVYATIPLLQNKKFLKRGDAFDFICVIVDGNPLSAEKACGLVLNTIINSHPEKFQIIGEVANCEELYQASATAKASLNNNLLNNEDMLDYLYVIAHSKGIEQACCAGKLATNCKILEKGMNESLEFVKAMAYAEEEYQAENAYIVATNKDVLSRENAIDFVRIVANTRGGERCSYVKDTAISKTTLQKENALSYIKAVASAKEYQIEYAMLTATDPVALKNPKSLENVMIIGHANGIKQAKMASEIVKNILLSSRKDLEKIVKIIARATSDKQAEYIYLSAINDILVNKEDMLKYIELIANAEKKDNTCYVYNAIEKKTIFKSFDSLKIVGMIANAKTETNSCFTSEAACCEELLKLPNHLEMLYEISNAKGDNQASSVYDISTDELFHSLPNLLDYVKLFANVEDKGQLFYTYSIFAYILTMNPKVLNESKAVECIKLLLYTDENILNKCVNNIFIKPEMNVEEVLEEISNAIQLAEQQIEQEEQNKYRPVGFEDLLKDTNIDLLIELVSNIENEDIIPETRVKIKIK